jgi:hypothetical protein
MILHTKQAGRRENDSTAHGYLQEGHHLYCVFEAVQHEVCGRGSAVSLDCPQQSFIGMFWINQSKPCKGTAVAARPPIESYSDEDWSGARS